MFSIENPELAKASNRVQRSNADASNRSRRAANVASASDSNLRRWVQAYNNNLRLRQGAETMETASVNFNRSMEAATSARLSSAVKAAEQAGAAMASQAASGTGGNVADIVNNTIAMRRGLGVQAERDRVEDLASDQEHRLRGIASQIIGGMDSSPIRDTLDGNTDVPQLRAELSKGNVFMRFVANFAASYMGNGGGKGVGSAGDAPNQQRTGTVSYGSNDYRGKSEDGSTVRFSDAGFEAARKEADDARFNWKDNEDYGQYL